MSATNEGLVWWERLRHEGLLLDAQRLAALDALNLSELDPWRTDVLRRRIEEFLDSQDAKSEVRKAEISAFVHGILTEICGFDTSEWTRGTAVSPVLRRVVLDGSKLSPAMVWNGTNGGQLPVFVHADSSLRTAKGRQALSRVLQWLRKGGEPLALLTSGQEWRLVFTGLDFESWCEWDVSLWFDNGSASPQVDALRRLLSHSLWTPKQVGSPAPLHASILEARNGQSELSARLGERVRKAVELLVRCYGDALPPATERAYSNDDLYQAAVRMVMRLVVVFFAESRRLLPVENPLYRQSYGLGGLRETLDRQYHSNRSQLHEQSGAWPRVLALFRIISQGTTHPDLQVPAYGGTLFTPGSASGTGLEQALHFLETQWKSLDAVTRVDDAKVRELIDLLSSSQVKIGRGKLHKMPIDFAGLSSEYIGILYEGLLDYELKRAPDQDPIVMLPLGKQPALPLSRLEGMSDADLKELFAKVEKDGKEAKAEETEGEDSGDADADSDAEPSEAEELLTESDEELAETDEATDEADPDVQVARALDWARRAVVAGGLVKAKRRRRGAVGVDVQSEIEARARWLVSALVEGGSLYLVRWGGTRKGSGSFYTQPGLSVPTARRTLHPLAYEPPRDVEGVPQSTAPWQTWIPKRPEQILSLKVCDPGCGSGSFPVAALRFLGDALYDSIWYHHGVALQNPHLQAGEWDDLITSIFGRPPAGTLQAETLPCRPVNDRGEPNPDFEPRLRSLLKRWVVERCIYGVDLNPLAVELAKLALWIETLDPTLPFSFLDHKIKCGNALVGASLAHFRHYPAMAWMREGGDGPKGEATLQIKEKRTGEVTTQLKDLAAGQIAMTDLAHLPDPAQVHREAFDALMLLHRLPVHQTEDRQRLYREKILRNPAVQRLRQTLDTWCAVWFWPVDSLDIVPLPKDFQHLSEEQACLVQSLAKTLRFFHWELEFPDVFAGSGAGFDAVVGNPPWETQKPNSKEYFSNLDPLYRTYGKQEALAKQRELFEQIEDGEQAWLEYNARFKALGNWCGNVVSPFGDGHLTGETFSLGKGNASKDLHALWQQTRSRFQARALPGFGALGIFQHQGSSDLNTYKLFLELAFALLRTDGQMGFVVPSGIYSDKGTGALRRLFLTQARWHWIFSFENREKIFEIDSRFKFCPIVVQKGGVTASIQTAFMRHQLADWDQAERFAVPYPRSQVEKFSPYSLSLLEIRSTRDIEILDTIYSNSVLLGDQGAEGWGFDFSREFHMTDDAELFIPVSGRKAKAVAFNGIHWRTKDGEDVVPLYQGSMINCLDSNSSQWVSQNGKFGWHDTEDRGELKPQFFVKRDVALQKKPNSINNRILIRGITCATNARTVLCAYSPGFPSGNSVNTITARTQRESLLLGSVLASFGFDFQFRLRMGANNVNEFFLVEAGVPKSCDCLPLLRSALSLNCGMSIFAQEWIVEAGRFKMWPWKALWAATPFERMRQRCISEAIVCAVYGLSMNAVICIFQDCDWPLDVASMKRNGFDPKGFWRIDKDKPPELRHTVLSLVAFHDLQKMIEAHGGDRDKGIEAFCNQNDGEGWMLPETLRLADYGLGHDDRALVPQPVASVLGPRFYDWQLAQSPEESWAECKRLAEELASSSPASPVLEASEPAAIAPPVHEKPAKPTKHANQESLF